MKTLQRFIKKPKKGDVIKIYTGPKSHRFGITVKTTMGKTKDGTRIQKVIVNRINRIFGLDETHYFLDKDRVIYTQKIIS